MQAHLDRVNGAPVLRCQVGTAHKRNVFDLPLTEEQAKAITIQSQAGLTR